MEKVQGAKKQDEASKRTIEARQRQVEKDEQIDAKIQKGLSEIEEQERQLQAAKEVAERSCQDLSSSD